MKKTLVLLGFVGLASFAMADPLCTAVSGGDISLVNETDPSPASTISVGNIFSGTNGCTLDGYTYSNFLIDPGADYTPGVTNVSVSFIVDAAAPGGFYFSIAQGSGQDIDIDYQVTPGVTSMELSLNIPGGPSEVGTVGENICTVAMGGCGLSLASGSVTTLNPTTIIGPITLESSDFVSKDVNAASGVFQSPVPEPMTFSLMGMGLLGLGFLGRRRAQK